MKEVQARSPCWLLPVVLNDMAPYSVINQLFHQLSAGHSRVTDREIETVGYRLVQIVIINDCETMIRKNLL